MSLPEESEEVLGKVRQALEQCDIQRRRADDAEALAASWRRMATENVLGETSDLKREAERLRLALQDAERRVKTLEDDQARRDRIREESALAWRAKFEAAELQVKTLEEEIRGVAAGPEEMAIQRLAEALQIQGLVSADGVVNAALTRLKEQCAHRGMGGWYCTVCDKQITEHPSGAGSSGVYVPCNERECMLGVGHPGRHEDALGREVHG